MQKSMKRLLSVLAVLALVLTMAPAGILAVETKAEGTEPEIDYTLTNWDAVPDADLSKAEVEAEQAKQTNALNLLKEMDDASLTEAEARRQYLSGKKCPFCEATIAEWKVPATNATNAFNNHYYIYGDFTFDTNAANSANAFLAAAGTSCCILMDGPTEAGANVNLNMSRVLQYNASTLNVGGKGKMYSNLGWVDYWTNENAGVTVDAGLFSVTTGAGAHELNLYGGNFYHTGKAYRKHTVKGKEYTLFFPVILSSGASNEINIWTDSVILGPETASTTQGELNVRATAGEVNIYGGTIRNGYSTVAYKGFNIFAYGSTTVNMYDGVIQGGKGIANSRGANVYLEGACRFNMYGGLITDGTVSGNYAQGGNISAMGNVGATITIKGGHVKDGYAPKGGNLNFRDCTMTIGGTAYIDGGKATTGGNIYAENGVLTIDGSAQIVNGANNNENKCASYGGNIYMLKMKDGTTIGGTISGGCAINGGNLYILGSTVDISATIKEGVAKFGSNTYIVSNSSDHPATVVTFSGGSSSDEVRANTNKLGEYKESEGSDILINNTSGGGKGATVTIKNGFNAHEIKYWTNGNTLAVDPSWTGTAGIYTNPTYAGGTLANVTAVGGLKGLMTNCNGHKIPVEEGENGTLKLVDFVVISDENEQKGFANAEEALNYADKKSDLRLVVGVNFEMNGQEVIVDAMGDVTVTGTGKIFGMDYENSDFVGGNGWISAPEGVIQPEANSLGGRYVALYNANAEHANAWSFHRVETKLTNVTVNVANAGIYYKAEYKFDEIVKDRIASYGVNVNLEGSTKEGQTSSSDMSIYDAESHTLTAKSHGVYGIFKDTNLASTNKENGQIKLCGNPYLAIDTTGNMEPSDCPEFTAAESTKMSLVDAMEMANEKWEAIKEEGKPKLQEFFVKWLEAGAWDAEWAAKLTNLIPAEA
jgi:hypothetical protein